MSEAPSFVGRIVGIYVAPEAGKPMEERADARAVAGRGLEGDRYGHRAGTYSGRKDETRAVTLIEREAVEAVRREYATELHEWQTRRNLVTEGVPLNHLVGREFTVGAVRMRGYKLSEPCSYLEELTRPGVRKALVHRGGLRAEVLSSGPIRLGDPVRPA